MLYIFAAKNNFDIKQIMLNRMDSNEVSLNCYLYSQFLKESLRLNLLLLM